METRNGNSPRLTMRPKTILGFGRFFEYFSEVITRSSSSLSAGTIVDNNTNVYIIKYFVMFPALKTLLAQIIVFKERRVVEHFIAKVCL